MKMPLALCMFTSTRGHYDRKDIYQMTVRKLNEEFPIDLFGQRLVHIKITPGEENIAKEMISFFEKHHFDVITSTEYWKHYDNTHMSGYLADVVKTIPKINQEYTLWMEDDWVLYPKNESLEDLLAFAMNELANNKNILSIRFPRHLDDNNHVHGHEGPSYNFSSKLNYNGYIFSFNPNISRSRDLYLTCNILSKDIGAYSYHCEHGFTGAMKKMANAPYPFAAFLPTRVQAIHIGEPEFEKEIEKVKNNV